METGNYGFLTNYENKPFMPITDTRYRKGNLLMEFLRWDHKIESLEEYTGYLKRFLEEGEKFNGTNIWLGNFHSQSDDFMIFAHN